MTSIFSLPPASSPASGVSRLSARTSGGDFVVPDSRGATPTGAVGSPMALADMQLGLLSLQAEQEGGDARGRRRARTLLAALAGLQLRLLAGEAVSAAALAGLRAELQDLPRPEDPVLAATLAAIVLRVEVELARRLAA